MARVYPRGAARRGVGGQAVMICQVTAAGALAECRIDSEAPVGFGFGAATLSLAKTFRMAPLAGGQSVAGAVVRIPIRFAPASR